MTSTQLRTYRAGQILGVPDGACVVVTSVPDWAEELTCAGEVLVDERPVPCSRPVRQPEDELRPGDRWRDRLTGLELRCIRGGPGPLRHGDRPMVRTFW